MGGLVLESSFPRNEGELWHCHLARVWEYILAGDAYCVQCIYNMSTTLYSDILLPMDGVGWHAQRRHIFGYGKRDAPKVTVSYQSVYYTLPVCSIVITIITTHDIVAYSSIHGISSYTRGGSCLRPNCWCTYHKVIHMSAQGRWGSVS